MLPSLLDVGSSVIDLTLGNVLVDHLCELKVSILAPLLLLLCFLGVSLLEESSLVSLATEGHRLGPSMLCLLHLFNFALDLATQLDVFITLTLQTTLSLSSLKL